MADLTPIPESTLTDVGIFNSTTHILTGYIEGGGNMRGKLSPFIPIVVANFAALPSSSVPIGILAITLDTSNVYLSTSSSGGWKLKNFIVAANAAALPTVGITDGAPGIALDTHDLYIYNLGATTWELNGGTEIYIVANFVALPSSGVVTGSLGMTLDTLNLYVAVSGGGQWKLLNSIVVADAASLPSGGINEETLAITQDTKAIYMYQGASLGWVLQAPNMGLSETGSSLYVQNKLNRAAKNTSLSTITGPIVVGPDITSGAAQSDDVYNIAALSGQGSNGILISSLDADEQADSALFIGGGNLQFTLSAGTPLVGNPLYYTSSGVITLSSTNNTLLGYVQSVVSGAEIQAYIYPFDNPIVSNSVTSVFGRSGAVAAQTNDYDITQIQNAGTAAAKAATDNSQPKLISLVGTPGDGNLGAFGSDGSMGDSTINVTELVTINTPGAGTVGNLPSFATPTVGVNDIADSGIPATAISAFKVAAVVLTNITGSNPGTSTFDGVTVTAGDLLLLTAQSSSASNGVWVFNGPSSAVTRSSLMSTWAEVEAAVISAPPSTTYPTGSLWRSTSAVNGTLGTTPITFSEISDEAAYTAGTGIDITGDIIAVDETVVPTYTGPTAQYQVAIFNNTTGAMVGVPNGVDDQILEWGASGPYWVNGGAGGSTPYYWLSGGTLANAIASGKPWIIVTASNSDTDAAIVLTQNTRITLVGSISLYLHGCDVKSFNTQIDGAGQIIFDGDNSAGYGFFTSTTGGTLSISETVDCDNTAAANTGLAINATDVLFQTTGDFKIISGSAPNTGINWNGSHTGTVTAIVNNASANDVILDAGNALPNPKSFSNLIIQATNYLGSLPGTWIPDASLPSTSVFITLSGFFGSSYPNGSAVKVYNLTGVSLPTPLVAGTTYYTRIIGGTEYELFETYEDTQTLTDPISITADGDGTYGIIGAQSFLTCSTATCSSNTTLYLSSPDIENIGYLTLCGKHSVLVAQPGVLVCNATVEIVSSINTPDERVIPNYILNSVLGPEGKILLNCSNIYGGGVFIDKSLGNIITRFQPIDFPATVDEIAWYVSVTESTFKVALAGFGDSTLSNNYSPITIDNLTSDSVELSDCVKLKLSKIDCAGGSGTIAGCSLIDCDNSDFDDFTVSEFTDFVGVGLNLTGTVAFTKASGAASARLKLACCSGSGGFSATATNIVKQFATGSNDAQYV